MIKVEVTEEFTLKDFNQLKNIKRKAKDVKGRLFVGDTFECEESMFKYLTGDNVLNKVVVKLIEVIKEAKVEETKEVKEEQSVKQTKKTTRKKKK